MFLESIREDDETISSKEPFVFSGWSSDLWPSRKQKLTIWNIHEYTNIQHKIAPGYKLSGCHGPFLWNYALYIYIFILLICKYHISYISITSAITYICIKKVAMTSRQWFIAYDMYIYTEWYLWNHMLPVLGVGDVVNDFERSFFQPLLQLWFCCLNNRLQLNRMAHELVLK